MIEKKNKTGFLRITEVMRRTNQQPFIKREASLQLLHNLNTKKHTHTQSIKERTYTNTWAMKVNIRKRQKVYREKKKR